MSPRYDVFLSHATADKPAVEHLARKLQEAGIAPFLDKWHLIPGDPWQETLEEALDESRTCAVFLGPKGMGAWQNEEMRSALESRVSNETFRVIPVLLPKSFESPSEPYDGTLRVWDLETGEALAVVTLDAPAWAVAVSPDGRIVMAGDQVGKVHFSIGWIRRDEIPLRSVRATDGGPWRDLISASADENKGDFFSTGSAGMPVRPGGLPESFLVPPFLPRIHPSLFKYS